MSSKYFSLWYQNAALLVNNKDQFTIQNNRPGTYRPCLKSRQRTYFCVSVFQEHIIIIIIIINCNWVSTRWQCSIYKYKKHKD
jgi:hypothetical protein